MKPVTLPYLNAPSRLYERALFPFLYPGRLDAMKHFALLVGMLVPLMVSLGCGPAGDDGPMRVPAAVTITHNGSPVDGANVTFVPKGDGPAAYGITDASGKAQLGTLGENDGAVPGDYQVMVQKTETAGSGAKADSNEVGSMPAGADAMQAVETRDLLPEKYGAIGTTDLEATVAESGENDFSFDLTD